MNSSTESTGLLSDSIERQPAVTPRPDIEDDVPFPWGQLGVLAICRVAEPIAFVSVTAYSFIMVKEIKGEENASFYSGLLVSAFALAEACTAFFWGQISDQYGRKPIILVALAGTALSNLLFGFATNYWLALIARVIGGLLNGNVAVMQTMVAEMIKKPEHEPKAYAMNPFMWSLGSIAGSAMGGYTAAPARSYPDLFSEDGIFGRFPYLLPNVIAVGIIVVAIVLTYLFLEETNPALVTPPALTVRNPQQSPTDETSKSGKYSGQACETADDTSFLGAPPYMTASVPLPNDPAFDLRRTSITSISSPGTSTNLVAGLSAPMLEIENCKSKDDQRVSPIKAFNKEVILWTLALFLMSYYQMAFAALLPIYMLDETQAQPQHFDLFGGLGLSLPDVGTHLAINSVVSLVSQGLIFPVFVEKLGVWWSVMACAVPCPLILLAAPLISLTPRPDLIIYVVMALQSFATIIIYPGLLILLKNATLSPLVLGKVNGLAQSLCSGARTISPPVVGIVYSQVGSAAAWWSCAVVAMVAAAELFFIRRPDEKNDMTSCRGPVTAD